MSKYWTSLSKTDGEGYNSSNGFHIGRKGVLVFDKFLLVKPENGACYVCCCAWSKFEDSFHVLDLMNSFSIVTFEPSNLWCQSL